MKRLSKFAITALIISSFFSCSIKQEGELAEDITYNTRLDKSKFQATIDSMETDLFIMRNDSMEVAITNYGARLVSMLVKGHNGDFIETIAGLDSLAAYIADSNNVQGAVIGRYAGQLVGDTAKVDERVIRLNNGRTAIAHRPWEIVESTDSSLKMRIVSPDGDGGMPGIVAMQAEYRLHRHNMLSLILTAITDKPTPINIAHSLSVNLDGVTDSTLTLASNHQLKLYSNQYLHRDSLFKPTGDMLMTIWTPLDFRQFRTIKSFINNREFDQSRWNNGINLYFVLPDYGKKGVAPAVALRSKTTGIIMEESTSYPGVELKILKNDKSASVTTHDFPDAPNHKGWDHKAVLYPGEVFSRTINYSFKLSDL